MSQSQLRLQMVYRPVASITSNPRNARTHSKKQIGQIVKSYKAFGVVNPILIDENSVIIAGHARLAAAQAMGLTEIATIQISHLSEHEKRALMIADNKLALNAGWDVEILAAELKELSIPDLDFDVEVTGFDMGEIDVIIDGPARNDIHDPADDAPDIDREASAVSRLGDLWLLGKHRLLCGSSVDAVSYDAVLGRDPAHMAFTDPPYNVAINGHVSGLGKVKHAEFQMASGEMTVAEFTSFLTQPLRLMAQNIIEGGIIYSCMDWRHLRELFAAADAAGLRLINLCVWTKTNGGMGSLYRSQHELVAVLKNGSAPHINNVDLGKHGRYRTNVWSYHGANSFRKGRDQDLADHPTVKPVALIADAIRDCSNRGQNILDPFGGSGSTLLAAERTGRHARLVELEPRYVDVTIRRWEELTGKKAVHATTGQTFEELKVGRSASAPSVPGKMPDGDQMPVLEAHRSPPAEAPQTKSPWSILS